MTLIKLGVLDPAGQVPYTKIGQSGEPEPWQSEKYKAVIRNVLGKFDLFVNVLRDKILPPDALLFGVKPSHLAKALAELKR